MLKKCSKVNKYQVKMMTHFLTPSLEIQLSQIHVHIIIYPDLYCDSGHSQQFHGHYEDSAHTQEFYQNDAVNLSSSSSNV